MIARKVVIVNIIVLVVILKARFETAPSTDVVSKT